ncbi:MAG TPA: PilZ domain-containing protein, partial [Myxococcota bacterium]|nr:PilZ domain-containing protein [Myxococcota bacterium]
RLVEAGAVEGDRRRQPRGRFDTSFLAETPTGPLVMIGRELSPGGMRVERIEELRVGDRFRLALHGPGPGEPIVVEAEVDRDDGRRGYALVFRRLDATTTKALEKLVACLPGVDSEGDPDPEVDDLGALLSEIMSS